MIGCEEVPLGLIKNAEQQKDAMDAHLSAFFHDLNYFQRTVMAWYNSRPSLPQGIAADESDRDLSTAMINATIFKSESLAFWMFTTRLLYLEECNTQYWLQPAILQELSNKLQFEFVRWRSWLARLVSASHQTQQCDTIDGSFTVTTIIEENRSFSMKDSQLSFIVQLCQAKTDVEQASELFNSLERCQDTWEKTDDKLDENIAEALDGFSKTVRFIYKAKSLLSLPAPQADSNRFVFDINLSGHARTTIHARLELTDHPGPSSCEQGTHYDQKALKTLMKSFFVEAGYDASDWFQYHGSMALKHVIKSEAHGVTEWTPLLPFTVSFTTSLQIPGVISDQESSDDSSQHNVEEKGMRFRQSGRRARFMAERRQSNLCEPQVNTKGKRTNKTKLQGNTTKVETVHIPLSNDNPDLSPVYQFKDKAPKVKTRPEQSTISELTVDNQEEEPTEALSITPPVPRLVKASTAEVFTYLFDKSEARPSFLWQRFVDAMKDVGFSVKKKDGSRVKFTPTMDFSTKSLTIHKKEVIGAKVQNNYARTLKEAYNWNKDTFVQSS
ncbi:hypothetical protein F5Y18DRAFT_443284 [Xylariaceae sp. FL1019]|nr:hypothetical protein F5Y18DRAFT_443284 [Xylariaceae sp. FL1019]